MGLFNRLGRAVEELKQGAMAASETAATHRCEACEAHLYADRKVCPECGSEQVVPAE